MPDHWISGPQIAAAHASFRQLEAQLLRVEQDYRLGKDSKSLTSLDGSISAFTAVMDQQLKEKLPGTIGWPGVRLGKFREQPLVNALKEILEQSAVPTPRRTPNSGKPSEPRRPNPCWRP